MSVKAISAAIAALTTLSVTAPSFAADLYPYDPQPHARYSAPYDDPRYSDVYRHPAPPPPRHVERYEQRWVPGPPPPRYVERYDAPPPSAYRSAPPREAYGCVPREAVRAELERQGWSDFHNFRPSADVVHLRARRPNGAVFELTLDSCTGQVIDRRFVSAPPPSYAWRERPDLYPRY